MNTPINESYRKERRQEYSEAVREVKKKKRHKVRLIPPSKRYPR